MTLTVGDLRKHITTDLVDPALQKLLDAAYAAINTRAGGLDAVSEFADGGYPTLILARPAGVVTSITETVGGVAIVLDPSDYRVNGYVVTRLATGTNPRSSWAATQTLYTPSGDEAERDRVAIGLVKLDLTHNPGLTSESIGDWTETYAANSAMNYGIEREMLLDSLAATTAMWVVGG